MEEQGSVSSSAARAICEVVASRGHDPAELLAASGLRAVDVFSGRRIAFGPAMSLWREALRRTRDGALPLAAAQRVPLGAHGVVDYLVVASATPRDALARAARYFGLINERTKLAFDGATFELIHSDGLLPPAYVEYLFASVMHRTRNAAGAGWSPEAIDFAFAAPAHRAEHERLFRCRIRYGQSGNRLRMTRAQLAVPQPFADAQLCEMLERHAAKLLADHGSPAADVRAVLLRLGCRDASFTRIAAELGMSARTLQRRLLASGTTWRCVLDGVRREVVSDALQDGVRITDARLARSAGYSRPRALLRAVRRWNA